MRASLVCLTVVFAFCITSCQREPAVAPSEGPPPQRQADMPPPQLPPDTPAEITAPIADTGGPWQQPGTTAGEEIVGPDGGKMVWVPPGQFKMGAEDLLDKDRPVHLVKITKGFWLGKCEVTNAQYRKFCEATDWEFPSERSDQADDHPVVWVSCEDAVAYCKYYWLRLPTEAEWEYAAAGPEAHKYPWGSEWDEKKCCNDSNQGPGGTTFPVGSFPEAASWCGALDMAGNVYEWCADWYASKYYAQSPQVDPEGPSRAEADDIEVLLRCRVLRGGSWYNDTPGYYRCAYRNDHGPSVRLENNGFRCARNP